MHLDLAHSLIPTPNFGFKDSLMRELLITSVHNIKIYGDSGSPCRIPLVVLIRLEGSSLISKEYNTEVMHSIIHLIQIE